VVAGLGPAGPELTTSAALAALRDAPAAFVRTARHPAAEALLEELALRPLDRCYEVGESFEEVYAAIVEVLVEAAGAHGRIAYAVPGSPLVAERTVELLRADSRLKVEIVPGLSFCDLAYARVGVDPVRAGVRLVDAASFATQAAGDPGPLLVVQCWSRELLSEVKLSVGEPPGGAVTILHHLGLPDERVESVAWPDLDRTLEPDHLTALYVPSLSAPVGRELVALAELVATLRRRCPWDAKQTHGSLVRHLLEESYEAIEAIEELSAELDGGESVARAETVEHVEEELGDLLCQVFFHARLASEEGLFDVADVARAVHDKLVRRHPHVFGDVRAESAEAVLGNWERQKQQEKGRASLTDGLPAAMPALAAATKLERRAEAAGLGFGVTGGTGDLAAALRRLLSLLEDPAPAVAAGDSAGPDVGDLLLLVARWAAADASS
jgi:tetrapyrrole methylase family protein/MazG family protein